MNDLKKIETNNIIKTPFISIGIASYNYEQFLPRALEAIKRQTFKNYEIIIVDDASSDNSIKVIKDFKSRNQDLSINLIINEKNEGILATKNKIIKYSKGKYLILCDSDDYMDDNCLEVLAYTAKSTNADRVISEVKVIDESGKIERIVKMPYNKTPSKWVYHLLHGNLFKKEIISMNNIIFKTLPDDMNFIEEFNYYTLSVGYVRQQIYNWCIHKNSASDYQKSNSIWNAETLIPNIVKQAKEIELKVTDIHDKRAIFYYVIKQYYRNLLLRKINKEENRLSGYLILKKHIEKFEKKYWKKYWKYKVYKTPDILVWKTFVMLCILLENLHLMNFIIYIQPVIFKFLFKIRKLLLEIIKIDKY